MVEYMSSNAYNSSLVYAYVLYILHRELVMVDKNKWTDYIDLQVGQRMSAFKSKSKYWWKVLITIAWISEPYVVYSACHNMCASLCLWVCPGLKGQGRCVTCRGQPCCQFHATRHCRHFLVGRKINVWSWLYVSTRKGLLARMVTSKTMPSIAIHRSERKRLVLNLGRLRCAMIWPNLAPRLQSMPHAYSTVLGLVVKGEKMF